MYSMILRFLGNLSLLIVVSGSLELQSIPLRIGVSVTVELSMSPLTMIAG